MKKKQQQNDDALLIERLHSALEKSKKEADFYRVNNTKLKEFANKLMLSVVFLVKIIS